MKDVLKAFAAICITERIFELLMPTGNLKKQLKMASGIVITALIVRIILGVFGR